MEILVLLFDWEELLSDVSFVVRCKNKKEKMRGYM